MDSKIGNFSVVAPGVLWRGARPSKEGAAWLVRNQVRTIVNLELVTDDLPTLEQVEASAFSRHEIGYFRIRDWEPLPLLAPFAVDENVARFLAILTEQPKPVFVHCRTGRNRTGRMVAAYRVIVEGTSIEDAVAEMARYCGEWLYADARYIRGMSLEHIEKILRRAQHWAATLKPTATILCRDGKCRVAGR
jgi:protein tyrosine/serine phosphatase